MPRLNRKYDDLGFPIPSTFEDLNVTQRDPPASRPPLRKPSRMKRIVLGLMLFVIVLVAVIPWLADLGQGLLGDWLAQRARDKFQNGDMLGTVADSTRALSLLGDDLEDDHDAELHLIRGCAKLRLNDLEGSLGDLDRVLRAPNTRRELRLDGYFHRSWVQCRLKDFTAAIDDITTAIEVHGRDNPVLLNQRAYIRALGKLELEDGLADVEKAMRMTRGRPEPAYIDTKGYLLHLLGENDKALREMNRAIHLTRRLGEQSFSSEDLKQIREDLAVMHHHRGLIHEALGMKAEAAEDFQEASEKGYNPDAGVL
jgi:tetratricopeptide (TPR) repeat protein